MPFSHDSFTSQVISGALLIYPFRAQLDELAGWIEEPIKDFPNFELVYVMAIHPIIMNVVFFWVRWAIND